MNKKLVAVSLVFLFVLAGCATLGVTPDNWKEKSPKEKSLIFMQLYSAQFEATKKMVDDAGGFKNLGPAQQKYVKAKVEVLTKLHSLITAYNLFVEQGLTPSVENERAILELLDQLTKMTLESIGGDA